MYRSSEKRIIGGVIGGLSESLGMSNPGLLRVLFIILTFAYGFGGGIYLLMWIFIPKRKDNIAQRLDELKKLHAKGIITDEDYKRKKSELLSM